MAQGKAPDERTEVSHKSNALSAAAYSKKSNSQFSRAKQSQSKKSSHARSHTQSNICPSVKSAAKSSGRMRLLSPGGTVFEARLPNDDRNYSLSPAAKHALKDGSLDPHQTFFGRTFNRKLRMRDTFTKIFPTYSHGEPTVAIPSCTHATHFYPKRNDLG